MNIADYTDKIKSELSKTDLLAEVDENHSTYEWPVVTWIKDVFRGVGDAFTDAVNGVFEVVKFVVSPSNWSDILDFMQMFDAWTTTEEVEKRVKFINSLDDIAKLYIEDVKTTYEEEGLAYSVGYLLPDLVLSVASTGGSIVSKSDTLFDLKRISGKFGTYTDVGKSKVIFDDASELSKLERITAEMELFDPNTKFSYIKGNYGEFRTVSEISKGNIPQFKDYDLHPIKGFDNLPDGLTASSKKGIDHVYANSNPPPDYIVVESKYNKSQLNSKTKHGRQMSEDWIEARLSLVGIESKNNNKPFLSRIDTEGNVTIKELDEEGYIIKWF